MALCMSLWHMARSNATNLYNVLSKSLMQAGQLPVIFPTLFPCSDCALLQVSASLR